VKNNNNSIFILNNIVIMFGLNFAFFRRKEFQTFRKTLNPDFKMNRKSIHKNPHAIPL
jgi:hypothetical protein